MITHTHTHPFYSSLDFVQDYPGETIPKKSKSKLDFTKAKNSEWQWHQLGRMQICTDR